MNQLLLNKPWAQFKIELEAFVIQGKALKDLSVATMDQVIAMEEEITAWDKRVMQWLENSFNMPKNSYVVGFYTTDANNFNIPNQQLGKDQLLFQLKGRIQIKTDTLWLYERILNISDAVVRSESFNKDERANMTIKQKREFILKKLFDLNDGRYYPLHEILKGNAVVMKHDGEAGEIANMLENSGLIDQVAGAGGYLQVKITAEGAQALEESMAPVTENYDDIRYSYAEISSKMDEIKEELQRSDLGHEILYNELQELKELYTTLNKKNWGQLLKGKLMDIAIGKLVDNSTLALVYEAITHHKFNLLS